jgi:putative sugar O-methyltransferase
MNNYRDLFYRPKLKFLKLVSEMLHFRKFPKKSSWTKWNEIDNYFSLLSTDLYFSNFRRSNLLIETMDYQNLDAKNYSKLLNLAGYKEPRTGKPIKPFMVRNSLNAGHQYRHIINYIKVMNIEVNSFKRIVEFGGGYGCMRWLISNLVPEARYEIIDNPGIKTLQERYLRSSLNPLDFAQTNWNLTINDLKPRLNSSDLFIGLWSVSETPTDLMVEILETLEKNSCNLLLAFQHDFNGRDNRDFFNRYFKFAKRKEISYPTGNLHSTYIFR